MRILQAKNNANAKVTKVPTHSCIYSHIPTCPSTPTDKHTHTHILGRTIPYQEHYKNEEMEAYEKTMIASMLRDAWYNRQLV